jgi:hypothetical protein
MIYIKFNRKRLGLIFFILRKEKNIMRNIILIFTICFALIISISAVVHASVYAIADADGGVYISTVWGENDGEAHICCPYCENWVWARLDVLILRDDAAELAHNYSYEQEEGCATRYGPVETSTGYNSSYEYRVKAISRVNCTVHTGLYEVDIDYTPWF